MIVSPCELGKAIGKGGSTVRKVEEQLGKRLRIVEYRDDVIEFVRNLVYPLQVQSITIEEKAVLLQDSNKKTKGLLIGREGKGLHILNRAVKRFFPELEVKVQ